MNRNNKILVGVLALIVAMTIGYALFSDKITITGTAKAKGDFEISATCEYLQEDLTIEEGTSSITIPGSSGATGACTVNGKTVTTTGNYSEPNEGNSYLVILKNTGSIPTVLKTVDSSNNYNAELDGPGDVYYVDKKHSLMANYTVVYNGIQDAVTGDQMVEQAKITLQPNEELKLLIMGGWVNSEDLGLPSQPKLPEEGVKMDYNVTFGFEQVTN